MKSKNNIYLFIALFRGGIVKGQSLLYKYKDSIWLFIHTRTHSSNMSVSVVDWMANISK